MIELTDDAILGGRLRLLQPRRGHRFGHDAVLLAAATPAQAGERVVELGAGVGAAALALAARVPGLQLTSVEIEPALVALAAENAARNGLAGSVTAVRLDVCAPSPAFAAAGLQPEAFSRVLMNPPFNDTARQNASPDQSRARAHMARCDTLASWTGAAKRLLAPGGSLTLIWRAEGLPAVLDAIRSGFGGAQVTPVHPKPHAPAIRILVTAVKNSSAALVLRPGLTLNDASGRPTDEAEAILRRAAPLRGAGQ